MGQFVMHPLGVTCGLTMLGVLGLPHAAWANLASPLPTLAVTTTSAEDLTPPSALESEPEPIAGAVLTLDPLLLEHPDASNSMASPGHTSLGERLISGGMAVPINLVQASESSFPTEPLEPSETSETSAPAEPVSPWRIEFRPYLQVPFAINGQLLFESFVDGGTGGTGTGGIGTGGTGTGGIIDPGGTLNLDLGFGLDLSSIFLLGGELEVWYNDFGLYLDGFYADLGSRVLAGRTANLQETPLQLGADYTRIGASLGWRAGRFPLANHEGVPPSEVFPAVTVDLFGGARYSSYGFDATLTNSQRTFRLNPNWIEPTLMTRAEFLFDTRTKVILNGYVGGFGIGNAPSLSWGGYAGLDWRFLPNVSIRPSYQFSSIDWNGDLGSITLKTQTIWLGFSLYF